MKFVRILLCLLVPVFLSAALPQAEFRTFTSADGRTLEAKVDNYNPDNGLVTLRLHSGGKREVPLDLFCAEDQSFLIEWREDYEKSFVRVDFYTHRIDSARIVFMLDSSGSMSGNRWEKMVRNMSDVIDRLDRHVDFNIILFGSDAVQFESDLVSASDVQKTKAKSWLTARRPSGGTNLLSAVKAARPMRKAEVYAILSDGYPNNEEDEIFQALLDNRRENDTRIRIFAVSYQSSNQGIDFMKDLAASFDGKHVKR